MIRRSLPAGRLLLALSLPLATGSAVAQSAAAAPEPGTPAEAQTTSLTTITVASQDSAERQPGATGVDAATLRLLRPATSDTASLLRDVPGLTLNMAGGVSSLPSMHGLADDRLRIKVDGMDLIASCPNHMNPPLSYVDPSNVGVVKVFAGISPVSVGGDSIGGTIAVETLAPEFAAPGEDPAWEGELGTFYRSNNAAVGGNASAGYATQTASIRYDGSWSRADNYTAGGDFKTDTATGRPGHTLPLDEVGSSAYETRNHTLGMALKRGSNLFDVEIGYQDMPEQLYPNQRMDLLDNEQKRINLGWSGAFSGGGLEAQVYHEQVEHFMDFGPDKRFWYGALSQPPAAPEVGTPCSPIGFMTCAAGMPMYSEGDTTGASLKAQFDLSPADLVRAGLEYQRYRLDDYWTASGGGMWPGTFRNINDGERDRMALYAERETQVDARWLALVGVRLERVETDSGDVEGYKTDEPAPGNQIAEAAAFNARARDRSDHNVDLAALARYRYSDRLDIEFGAARKVRSPNLYERYTWSSWPMAAIMNNTVGDGNGYVGNVDLDAETAYKLSATFDWHAADRSWEFSATPYYTRVEDYIDAVPFDAATFQPGQFNVLQYANQSARLFGVDLAGQLPLGSNAWGTWGLKGLVTYTDGENRDTGDALYNIMPLNARFTLTHKHRGWDNALEWVLVDSKDDGSDVRNEIRTAGYALLHLRASHSWQRVRVDFGVENLFDKFYFLPTGGAYLGQGTTMQINAVNWGTAVPGMGRSIYAGLSVSF
jgi:iron complex outermembrane receptor protein